MRHLFVLALVFSGTGVLRAQLAVNWTKLAASGTYDFGYAVALDPSGNCIIAGATQGSITGGNAGRYDLFVAKYDPSGTRLWVRQRGTAEREFAYGVATDAAGNIYVTGYTGAGLDGNTSIGDWDVFISKFDAAGTWAWTRQIGSGLDDEGRAITTDASGNIYVTGYVRGNLHGNTRVGASDVFISKYDTNGSRAWTVLFGSPGVDESFGIACDAAGNVYATGWCDGSIEGNPYLANGDNFLVKYNTNGQRQWLRQWGTFNKDTGYALACDAGGNVYMSGYTTGNLYGPPQGNRDYFLVKYDSAGTQLWASQVGTSGHDQAWGVAVDAFGNALVAGESGGSIDGNVYAGGLDIFVSKYNPAGSRLWTKQVGTSADDLADGIAVGGDGAVYLTGTTTGSLDGNVNQGLNDAFVMRLSSVLLPPTNPSATPSSICSRAPVQLSATPGKEGDAIEWFTGSCGGTPVPGGSSPTVNPAGTTDYFARSLNTSNGLISNTCAMVTVHVVPSPVTDIDTDCDVDQADFASFAACLSGSNIPLAGGCESSDFDGDADVDQADFGKLQRCYSGEGVPANPACAN